MSVTSSDVNVTSSDVNVTSAISSNVDVTSPITSDMGLTTQMWKRLNVYWVFVPTVLARKFHKNLSEISVGKMQDFIFVFHAKKIPFWD
jgi:hypothetical protein